VGNKNYMRWKNEAGIMNRHTEISKYKFGIPDAKKCDKGWIFHIVKVYRRA
jgi:hypothetical protein